MNLMPLLDLLDNAGIGSQGTSLFLNMMPLETTQGVLLRPPLTGTPINYELPGFYKTRFQAIVRASKFEAGQDLAAQVAAALTLVETQVETLYIRYCRPTAKPVSFPLSNGSMVEWNIPFEVCYNEDA